MVALHRAGARVRKRLRTLAPLWAPGLAAVTALSEFLNQLTLGRCRRVADSFVIARLTTKQQKALFPPGLAPGSRHTAPVERKRRPRCGGSGSAAGARQQSCRPAPRARWPVACLGWCR